MAHVSIFPDKCISRVKKEMDSCKRSYSGWWFGTWILFFHISGIITPTDFHIFQRGCNHRMESRFYSNFYQVPLIHHISWLSPSCFSYFDGLDNLFQLPLRLLGRADDFHILMVISRLILGEWEYSLVDFRTITICPFLGQSEMNYQLMITTFESRFHMTNTSVLVVDVLKKSNMLSCNVSFWILLIYPLKVTAMFLIVSIISDGYCLLIELMWYGFSFLFLSISIISDVIYDFLLVTLTFCAGSNAIHIPTSPHPKRSPSRGSSSSMPFGCPSTSITTLRPFWWMPRPFSLPLGYRWSVELAARLFSW